MAAQEPVPGALDELLSRWDQLQASSPQQYQHPQTAPQPHRAGTSDVSGVGADWPDLSALVTDAVDEMLRREVEQYGLDWSLP